MKLIKKIYSDPLQKNTRTFLIVVSLIVTTIFILSHHAYARTLRVEVFPTKVMPGDVFLIKVTGSKTASVPSASLENTKFSFNSCGADCYVAVGAVDIKTKPAVYAVEVIIGEKKKNLKLRVKKAHFRQIKITLPEDKVVLKPEDLMRSKKEDEKLSAIFSTVSEKLWDGGFMLPLENCLLTPFGTERIMNGKWTSVHKGVDIKGADGEEIKASNRGKVVLAENLFFGGNTIIIDHGQGIYSIYMHLSKMNIRTEDVVLKGDVIGLVGSTGRATGPHLHFGVKVLNINVNPVSLTKLNL